MAYASYPRRALALLMISTVLVSCTADGLVPPAPIDRGTRVSAIQPPAMPVAGGYNARTADPYRAPAADYSTAQPQPMPPGTDAAPRRLPKIDSDEALGLAPAAETPRVLGAPPSNLGSLTYSPGGVNIDSELGVGQAPQQAQRRAPAHSVAPAAGAGSVVGLAEEQNADIAEGNSSQPVVDGIGTDAPVAVGRRPQPAYQPMSAPMAAQDDLVTVPPKRGGRALRGDAAPPARWSDQSMVTPPSRAEPEPQEVAMLMPNRPDSSPQMSARTDAPMPASEVACRRELKRMGVEFSDKPRISQGASCGIDYPVSLSGLSGNINVKPAVTLNCQTTLAFAKWVKNELAPSARARYLTGIGSIQPMGGYSCRRMNNSRQRYNPMSEHAKGNAIDIGRFTLKNGHEIDVRQKGFFAFRERGLLKAVRSDSCKYFNTVLGPGSNPEHWNHFHFDLRSRASGNRYCD